MISIGSIVNNTVFAKRYEAAISSSMTLGDYHAAPVIALQFERPAGLNVQA